MLLVEQYVERALALAETAIILRHGRRVWSGAAPDAATELVSGYLGDSR